MRSGNLHLLLLTRDNENQPLLIAVREQAAQQNKRPAISNAHGYALTPALPASGVTHGSFQEAAYLLANRRSALPLSALLSLSSDLDVSRCCLCNVAASRYKVCSSVAAFASQPASLNY